MIRNFFKAAYRSLLRNKLFSVLNILGLAIGMVACFFIFRYIYFERSFEKYNVNADNIYRVSLEHQESSGNNYIEATNHPATGPALKANFPEVISFARLIPAKFMLATATISRIKAGITTISDNEKRVFFADAAVLKMFSVPMIYGKQATALSEMRAIVISESAAKKYFGSENPMNKTLFLNGSFEVTVSGVFKDIPENSHLKFDMLISFPDEKFQADNWNWSQFYTYVMLAPGTSSKRLQSRFPAFIDRYPGSSSKQNGSKTRFYLQPVKDIHLHSHYLKELEVNGSNKDIWLLSMLSFFVLLIACINYINLSTAKMIERTGEIGLRKIIGASKLQLVLQFLTESFLVNCLAIILAGLIVLCLTPFYETLINQNIKGGYWTSGIMGESGLWIILLLIVIVGPFLIGIYPALLMSKYNPVLALKGKFYRSQNGIIVRKVLVAFQFTISILLIAGTLIFLNQLAYMKSQSLGYSKDQILVIKTPGIYDLKEYPKIYSLQKRLLNNTAVNEISFSSEIPGEPINRQNDAAIFGGAALQNVNVAITQIDDHFLNAYHIQLVAGRNFKQQDSVDIVPIDGVSYPIKFRLSQMNHS